MTILDRDKLEEIRDRLVVEIDRLEEKAMVARDKGEIAIYEEKLDLHFAVVTALNIAISASYRLS